MTDQYAYEQEKKRLSFKIDIIRGFDFHEPLANALENAITLAHAMPEEAALTYLQGLNQALGNTASIARWQEDAEILAKTCDNLTLFIIKNYPKDKSAPWEIRGKALLHLLEYALFLVLAAALIAGLASLLILAVTVAVIPIFTCFLWPLYGIAGLSAAFLFARDSDLDSTDCILSLLIEGERTKDKVNSSILQNFSIFASASLEHIQNTPACSANIAQDRPLEAL